MPQYRIDRGRGTERPQRLLITLIVGVIVALFAVRTLSSYVIDVEWWKELGQLDTWLSMLTYSFAPLAAATLLAFGALWVAHARALKFAGTSLGEHSLYAKISALGLLILGYIISAASIDNWTVVRFAGSRGLAAAAEGWRDALFQQPLSFYLFDLPFYNLLRGYVLGLVIVAILVYWIAARGWQLRYRISDLHAIQELDASFLKLEGGLESRFLRGAAVVLLVALAFRFYLARYEMVYNEHGTFLVGADWVDQNVGLPLQWLLIFSCIAAAALVWMGRLLWASFLALSLVISFVVPGIVSALYVRPNEISLERPYVQTHIHATRSAYGIERNVREIEFKAQPEESIDVAQHDATLGNVRLWDTQAFHDTVTQIQALRPYYTFHDSDVDRYVIDGQYRQVLVAPRELDISQLPSARASWSNPAFTYTHGYGLVLAPVAKITPDGLPVLLIDNAPAVVKTKSLTLTRPELYYGEVTHEPVFVNTAQEEFNYPSGEDNVRSRYEGKGGFPISSFFMRMAAAIREGEPNILLTDYFTANSRMMIRRRVRERLQELAGFLEWDPDPYLVLTDAGRLVWMVDGYTTSDAHPYSRAVDLGDMGRVNYIRNAVKATVDAYDGETHLYVFAPDDPLIGAYQRLFSHLFRPASEMPADLRKHARYPEVLFRVQAEIYRTYHMLDPQSFYNKEDLWDLARHASGQNGGGSEPVTPTYIVAALPGEKQAEFLLMTPFTPRGKDNLIGLMAARCDGPHLGEVVVLMLSKQELIFGPMQIAARINQDQTISKDLTLWNQQGSQVLRSQTLVLPVGNTFLYVETIYIQATEAKMPQLKKVVLAVGNRMIYRDTYEEALAQLAGGNPAPAPVQTTSAAVAAPATGAAPPAAGATGADARLQRIGEHWRKYKELTAQGKISEAGKELEAIQAELKL